MSGVNEYMVNFIGNNRLGPVSENSVKIVPIFMPGNIIFFTDFNVEQIFGQTAWIFPAVLRRRTALITAFSFYLSA